MKNKRYQYFKNRKPGQVKESDIKHQIIAYCNLHGGFVWLNRNVAIRKPGGGWIPPQVYGVPDIIGYTKEGRMVGIEVKRPSERTFVDGVKNGKHLLTKNGRHVLRQIAFLRDMEKAGCIALLVYSMDEVKQYWEDNDMAMMVTPDRIKTKEQASILAEEELEKHSRG